MQDNPHHVHLLKELAELLKPVFSRSPQAIYLYLDDNHKTCNTKFAKMLGYSSVQQWVDNPYPVSDVAEKDQKNVIKAYMDASRKFIATTLSASLVKKDGKKIQATVTLVPLSYVDEVFVLHFISLKK